MLAKNPLNVDTILQFKVQLCQGRINNDNANLEEGGRGTEREVTGEVGGGGEDKQNLDEEEVFV